MALLLKYWPILLFGTNLLAVWVCWSLRQLAKNEVQALVSSATGPINAAVEKAGHRADDHHDKLGRHESRLDSIETDIKELPTKADLARVEGEVRAVGQQVGAANAGIHRIEGFFLERGVERV